MAAYSKFFGAIVGGILAWLVAKFSLPADWATGDFAAALTTIITAVVVAVLAFVGGWLMKGLQSLEKFVASTATKADDEVLKKVKEVLANWSKPAA